MQKQKCLPQIYFVQNNNCIIACDIIIVLKIISLLTRF